MAQLAAIRIQAQKHELSLDDRLINANVNSEIRDPSGWEKYYAWTDGCNHMLSALWNKIPVEKKNTRRLLGWRIQTKAPDLDDRLVGLTKWKFSTDEGKQAKSLLATQYSRN